METRLKAGVQLYSTVDATLLFSPAISLLLLNPILDGGEGGKFAPPAVFFNIAQKPLGLGS